MDYSRLFFRALAAFGCAALLGCVALRAKKLERWYPPAAPVSAEAGNAPQAVGANLHYLGCGGFLLEYGGEMLLMDPYFSNMGMIAALTGKMRSDTALINKFFRERLGSAQDTAGKISTVLISHAHHDHLADVPTLLRNNLSPEKTRVYGSRTMVNLLRSHPGIVADMAAQLLDLEKQFSVRSHDPNIKNEPEAGPFVYTSGRRIRFAAVPSGHAGHYFFWKGHKLPGTEGNVESPLAKPPSRVLQFKEGENFNFLIDLLDESGNPVFRIFSNAGAACDAGVGFPPQYLLQEKPVDLLLMCGANYNLAKNYPGALLEHLRPHTVWVAHWENFFKPIRKLQKRPEVVPNTDIPKLMRWLEKFSKEKGFPKRIFLEHPLGRAAGF
ncbi:MAG: MBL fold metallo-hydrolase [Saprospiraceae bacterium]